MKKDVYYWPENNAFSVASAMHNDDFRMATVSRGLTAVLWGTVMGVIAYGMMYLVLRSPAEIMDMGIMISLKYLIPLLFLPSVILMGMGCVWCMACPENYVPGGRWIVIASWAACLTSVVLLWMNHVFYAGSVTLEIPANLLMAGSCMAWYYFLMTLAKNMQSPENVGRAAVTFALYALGTACSAAHEVLAPGGGPGKLVSSLIMPYVGESVTSAMYFHHVIGLLTVVTLAIYLFLLWGIIRRIQLGNLPEE